MLRRSSTGYRAALLGFAVVAGCAIFTVPYHVPLQPSLSDSYVFHFNNRVCWLLVLASAGLLAAFGPDINVGPDSQGKPLTRRTLHRAVLASSLLSAALALWTRKLNGFDEAIYLIDRLRLVLEGRVPYRDFEFAYGAGLLYVPAAMARVLHLGAADAYGLFFVLASAAGTWLLYRSLCLLPGTFQAKRSMFLLFWAVSLFYMLTLGVNYSLLRYTLPLFCAVQLYERIGNRAVTGRSLARYLWAVGAYAVLLLDSPELAVAFAAAAAIYLLFCGVVKSVSEAAGYLGMLLGFALVSFAAYRAEAFRTLQAFSTGGSNLPVMPGPHILLLLTAITISSCLLGTMLRSGRNGSVLPVAALGQVALGAALGRCDPGHVLLNGMPLFVLAGLVTAGRRRLWAAFLPLVWLVYLWVPLVRGGAFHASLLGKAALPTVLSLEHTSSMTRLDTWILQRMTEQMGATAAEEKFAEYRMAANRRGPLDLDGRFDQSAGTVFQAPYGFSVTHFGLLHSPNVDEGYYFETINVVTPEQVQQKVQELRAHAERPLLLLPGRESACGVSGPGEQALLSSMFLYPYRARPVNEQSLNQPLCDYIHTHYQITMPATAAQFGYALWSPKP